MQNDYRARRWIVGVASVFMLACVLAAALYLQQAAPAAQGAGLEERLLDITNVWTVHLTFAPDQWDAMEPAGGGGPFGGGPPGAGGPGFGGPPGMGGRGGGPPGGPRGFGPGMFLATSWLKAAGANGSTNVSRQEFVALAQKWFTAWDTNKSGVLDLDKVRLGLNRAFARGGGPPGGGPGGPPGAGPQFVAAEGKRNGMAGMMGVDYKYVRADLEFGSLQLKGISVRYKGNNTFMTSRNSLKRPLKLDLNRDAPGRNLGGVTKLNLHNNVNDPGWMNEVLSHRLFRDAGVPAPRTSYARVYVTISGKLDHKYFGLYSIVENVDARFVRQQFGTKKGALFKPTTRRLFEDMGDKWQAYAKSYDPKMPVSDEETQRVIEFSKLVSHASDAEFAARLDSYLDLDEFARFMAITTWLSTMDSILMMGQNFLVYLHPKTGQFQFISWDLDHSFGQFPMAGNQELRENLSIHKPWAGENRFLERVFNMPAFKNLYLAKLHEFNQGICKPERIATQVDELSKALRPAVEEESQEKRQRFDKVVAGEAVSFGPFGPGGGPEGGPPQRNRGGGPPFGPPGGFGQAAKPIKGFVVARWKAIAGQLAGQSEGMSPNQGFGPPGGGPGGPGNRGPGGGPPGADGFGPGMFLAAPFLKALDEDADGKLSLAEMTNGFAKWHAAWNKDGSGALTEAQLREGINSDLAPFRGGPGGFGPPPDMPRANEMEPDDGWVDMP